MKQEIICNNDKCDYNNNGMCYSSEINLECNNEGYYECLTDTSKTQCFRCDEFFSSEDMVEFEEGLFCKKCAESYHEDRAWDEDQKYADYMRGN